MPKATPFAVNPIRPSQRYAVPLAPALALGVELRCSLSVHATNAKYAADRR